MCKRAKRRLRQNVKGMLPNTLSKNYFACTAAKNYQLLSGLLLLLMKKYSNRMYWYNWVEGFGTVGSPDL
jgi:hypothetical protein